MEKHFEDMMLGGRIIKIEVTTLPIEKLEIDRDNPRIQYRLMRLANSHNLDEVILDMPEVKELKKDIEGNGGVRERPYVQFNKELDKYKVIEGNCRTACYRDLHKRYTTDNRWAHMPVRIFPEDLSGREIAIFLSDQHVSGKIPWKAHEQAGQIYRMHHEHKMTEEEIARYLRIKVGQVQQLYKAYELMTRFIKVDNGKYGADGEGKFSYFHNALKSKGVRELLESDDKAANEFCRWVGEDRFPKANDVLKLDKILNCSASSEAWWRGATFNEAMKIIEELDPTIRKDQPIFKYLQQVQDACGELKRDDIEAFSSDQKAQDLFAETRKEIEDVIDNIQRHAHAHMRQAAE